MREIWINWSPAVEYVASVRSAIDKSTPSVGPASHHQIVTDMRQHYGLYMFLEKKGVDKARDEEIRDWRTERGVKQFAKRNLVYIGIVKSEYRDFVTRMKEHEGKWLYQYKPGELFVKFGVCEHWEDEPNPDRLIEHAESVLVFEMQPYENTDKLGSYTMRTSEDHICIHNKGHYTPLKEKMDSKKHF
ncbi:hypothetical protein [Roseibium sp. SCP14]|uniref:hypothetical protein n=1 Tax=Roseibium sp. SCP14 TaxID=3141375 RepID=UPI00333856D0